MEFIRWLGTLALGAAIGIGVVDGYDRHFRPAGRGQEPIEGLAAIVDGAIRLGWECHNETATAAGMTLDGCRQLAAGVQKIGD